MKSQPMVRQEEAMLPTGMGTLPAQAPLAKI